MKGLVLPSLVTTTTDRPSMPPSVKRSFYDLSDSEVADIQKVSFHAHIGWREGFGWNELLRSERVLMISEAGAGKTYECREHNQVLISGCVRRRFCTSVKEFFESLWILLLSAFVDSLGRIAGTAHKVRTLIGDHVSPARSLELFWALIL